MLIFILDDNKSELATCATLLENKIQGATTLKFDDEEVMMKYLRKSTLLPNLILIELQVPGLDVWQLVQDLRTEVATKNIPIAFFSRSNNPKNFIFASRLNIPLFIHGNNLREKVLGIKNLFNWLRNLQLA